MIDAMRRQIARMRTPPQISWLTVGNHHLPPMNQIAISRH
jgi:hypothetical protein